MNQSSNVESVESRSVVQEELRRRLNRKYPELFPLPKISAEEKQSIRTQLEGADFGKGVVVCHPRDRKNCVFLYGLCQIGDDMSITCENAYRLVEIDLGKVEETDSIFKLDTNVLAIWLGYHEPSNKRTPETLQYAMELAASRGPLRQAETTGLSRWNGQAFWLYFKGTEQQLAKDFPTIIPLAKELGFSVIDLKS